MSTQALSHGPCTMNESAVKFDLEAWALQGSHPATQCQWRMHMHSLHQHGLKCFQGRHGHAEVWKLHVYFRASFSHSCPSGTLWQP